MSSTNDYDDQIRSAMRRLADTVSGPVDVHHAIAGVTQAAVELIRGVDYADVLLIHDGQFESASPTDPIVAKLDRVQHELQEGPCLAAAIGDPLIRCTDLREDPRWPEFADAAIQSGVYSMLSYQLYTRRGGAGALNLLGCEPRAFTPEAEALGAMLATHAANALAAANIHEQFTSALASRDSIGQAKGILMERFDIDAIQAFDLLRKLSQETNTPIRKLVKRIINRDR